MGGCSDKTINGMEVIPEPPYWVLNKNNKTGLAGSWYANHKQGYGETSDDESGVELLFANPLRATWVSLSDFVFPVIL